MAAAAESSSPGSTPPSHGPADDGQWIGCPVLIWALRLVRRFAYFGSPNTCPAMLLISLRSTFPEPRIGITATSWKLSVEGMYRFGKPASANPFRSSSGVFPIWVCRTTSRSPRSGWVPPGWRGNRR